MGATILRGERFSQLIAAAMTHPEEKPLRTWDATVRQKRYGTPHVVLEDFRHAHYVGDRREVFNVRGNKYRLVVDVRYGLGGMHVRDANERSTA